MFLASFYFVIRYKLIRLYLSTATTASLAATTVDDEATTTAQFLSFSCCDGRQGDHYLLLLLSACDAVLHLILSRVCERWSVWLSACRFNATYLQICRHCHSQCLTQHGFWQQCILVRILSCTIFRQFAFILLHCTNDCCLPQKPKQSVPGTSF